MPSASSLRARDLRSLLGKDSRKRKKRGLGLASPLRRRTPLGVGQNWQTKVKIINFSCSARKEKTLWLILKGKNHCSHNIASKFVHEIFFGAYEDEYLNRYEVSMLFDIGFNIVFSFYRNSPSPDTAFNFRRKYNSYLEILMTWFYIPKF